MMNKENHSPFCLLDSYPIVTICVLVVDKPQMTQECLNSLLTTEYPRYEIVVVSNGGDRSIQMLLLDFQKKAANKAINCILLLNASNIGAASGRNQVLRFVKSSYVAFLDNDTFIASPDWLSILVKCLESDHSIAIAGAKLLFYDRPEIIQHAGGGVSSSGRVCDMGRNEPRTSSIFNKSRDVQFQSSACMLLSRGIVPGCGYFDTAFDPVLFEEIDYCYRVRSKGYRIRYVSQAEVYHHENATTFGSGLNSKYLFIKHLRIFKERWRHMYENENGPTLEDIRRYNVRL